MVLEEQLQLKEKSEETGIPYANLVQGLVNEQLVDIIATSTFSKVLWLKNDNILGLEACERRLEHRVYYYYKEDSKLRTIDGFVPGQKMDDRFRCDFKDWLLGCWRREGYETTAEWEDDRTLYFDIVYEKIHVPIRLIMEVVQDQSCYPVQNLHERQLTGQGTFSYHSFPLEERLADHLFQIVKNLELLNEMEHYLRTYELLTTSSISGRKVSSRLQELCEKDKVSFSENHIRFLKQYRDYTYMKRKWKVLLRRQHIAEPSWEEVLDLTVVFLEPIWSALCNDDFFLEDWMPELGRFLD